MPIPEIEYRCYDTIDKTMHYGVQRLYDYAYLGNACENHEWSDPKIGNSIAGSCFGQLLCDNTLITMPSTGYVDYHGTKVYLRDICRYAQNDVWHYGVVNWDKGSFVFIEFKPQIIMKYFHELECVPDISVDNKLINFEVLGNVYQNPELCDRKVKE